MRKIYLIGSMKNPRVAGVATALRARGHAVFDDWFSAGPEADDCWQRYEADRGRSYLEALNGHHARNVFEFDKRHLDAADTVVLVMPAGRSAHMELGYSVGRGKRCFVLFDAEPERYDIMYLFADAVFMALEPLLSALNNA